MSALRDVLGTFPGYLIYFAAMILTASQLVVLLHTRHGGRARRHLLPALAHFLLLFFFLAALLGYSYYAVLSGKPEVLSAFELFVLSLPWLLSAGFELLSAALIVWRLRMFRQYRRTHVSEDAIRETVDLLPAGLLIADGDGTVLLANLKMTELCRILTGGILNDADRLWQAVERGTIRENLVRTPDGETWQFARSGITLDERDYVQITASDMTEQYRVTEQLTEKQRHLEEVRERLLSVSAAERELAEAREIMNARMTVHDRMGAVLLTGKYYLDHPENVKEDELLRMLQYGSSFLLGEAQTPEENGDPLREATETARRIGVEVEIRGPLPEDRATLALLAQAAEQCAANTVLHAGGDRLSIETVQDVSGFTAVFTNNGRPPEGPITETGGLAVLRRAVEAVGGVMTVETDPRFTLTLVLLKKTE